MIKTVLHPSAGEVFFHRVKGHVPKKNQNKLEELLTGAEFPWRYNAETVMQKPKPLKQFDDISILGHTLIRDGQLNSEYFNPINTLLDLSGLVNKFSLSTQIIRAQANLFLKRDRVINPCPHIDFQRVRHMVVLYYVNDCDGDTVFYNLSDCDDHRLDEMKEWRRESPKKGDIIIFDGKIFHSPSCPVESLCRSTLNFDFSMMDV